MREGGGVALLLTGVRPRAGAAGAVGLWRGVLGVWRGFRGGLAQPGVDGANPGTGHGCAGVCGEKGVLEW